jgi:hypothetical protein
MLCQRSNAREGSSCCTPEILCACLCLSNRCALVNTLTMLRLSACTRARTYAHTHTHTHTHTHIPHVRQPPPRHPDTAACCDTCRDTKRGCCCGTVCCNPRSQGELVFDVLTRNETPTRCSWHDVQATSTFSVITSNRPHDAVDMMCKQHPPSVRSHRTVHTMQLA